MSFSAAYHNQYCMLQFILIVGLYGIARPIRKDENGCDGDFIFHKIHPLIRPFSFSSILELKKCTDTMCWKQCR